MPEQANWMYSEGVIASGSIRLLALAPLVFLAHFVEEAFGFLDWFNALVEPDMAPRTFYVVNGFALAVTALLAAAAIRWRDHNLGLVLIAWLSFLMLTNGALHITASFMFAEYVPGAITSVVLYLPFFVFAVVTICREFEVQPRAAMIAAAIGAVPMVLQGVSVLADGHRLLW
jgi:hypothetical protein